MLRRTRKSEHTGKVSACCKHVEGGIQCDNAVFANGYCWKHQGKLRLRNAAQIAFLQSANTRKP